jgi:hypothetical protein
MAWVFVNNTNAPVNIGIYNAGILYYYKNHVQPFSEATCKVENDGADWPGINLLQNAQGQVLYPDTCAASFDVYSVWYDIFVTYDTPGTELDKGSNWQAALNIGSLTLGALLTVAGIAMLWVPGVGAAVTVAGVELSAAAITAIGYATAGIGTVLTGLDIAGNIASAVMAPGFWKTWYGYKDYMNVINGGFTGTITNGKLTVDSATPLSIHWTNLSTGESGDAAPSGEAGDPTPSGDAADSASGGPGVAAPSGPQGNVKTPIAS